MLATTARDAGAPLPLLILHDVAWPYGRRDLYYEPSRIPEEFRQPHRQGGMRPGRSGLLPNGGMNLGLDNAEAEGGPRNGVMTALDDFMAEHDRPLRRAVLPVYYGLAIVAEEERLAANPALAGHVRPLREPRGTTGPRRPRPSGSGSTRPSSPRPGCGCCSSRSTGAPSDTCRSVKAALLDEHYLDNEVRLDHLGQIARAGPAGPRAAPRSRSTAAPAAPAHQPGPRRRAVARRRAEPRLLPVHRHGHGSARRLEGMLDLVRAGPCPGRPRGDRRRSRRGGHLPARLPGGPRGAQTGGSGWSTSSSPTVRTPTRATGAWRPPWPASAPTCTRCATGSRRFGLLDDSVRFVQGAPEAPRCSESGIDQLALVRLGEGLGDDARSHPRRDPPPPGARRRRHRERHRRRRRGGGRGERPRPARRSTPRSSGSTGTP